MNQKIAQRCLDVVAPVFAAGEIVELIDVVQVGKVSTKRQLATSAAVGIVTGGTVVVALRPMPYYLVLTDRRLYLVEYNNGRVGRTIAAATPREKITAGPLRGHVLTLSMELHIAGAPGPVRFSWGRAQSGTARRIATAITATPAAPAA